MIRWSTDIGAGCFAFASVEIHIKPRPKDPPPHPPYRYYMSQYHTTLVPRAAGFPADMIDLENDPGAKKNSGGIEYRYLPRSGGLYNKECKYIFREFGRKRGVTSEEARFQNLKALQGCKSTIWPCPGQSRPRQSTYTPLSYQLLSR